MIFVDTNVIMYAVGRPHPLRDEARSFFESAVSGGRADLCTSAEVLQELLHGYLPVRRLATLGAALTLVRNLIPRVLPVDAEDIWAAFDLVDRHSELGARDLLHLAVCIRYQVPEIMTFDRALETAFRRR